MKPQGESKKIKWNLDPVHSEISFKVKHLMITNVKGVFREYSANIFSSADDIIPSDIEVIINPASIDTGEPSRDAHLKSPDFFDVESFREIKFTGNSYEKTTGEGNFLLNGDLSIRGVKKPVSLEVEYGGVVKDPWGNEKAGFTITGKINRKDWGLNWNTALEAGGVLVADEVKISCEVELVKQA